MAWYSEVLICFCAIASINSFLGGKLSENLYANLVSASFIKQSINKFTINNYFVAISISKSNDEILLPFSSSLFPYIHWRASINLDRHTNLLTVLEILHFLPYKLCIYNFASTSGKLLLNFQRVGLILQWVYRSTFCEEAFSEFSS